MPWREAVEIGGGDRRRPRRRARARVSSIAISSRRTCSSPPTARSRFSTSAWRCSVSNCRSTATARRWRARRRHVVLGTFGYMSPEQVTGERVDGRSRHLRARLRVLRDAERPRAVRRRHAAGNHRPARCTTACPSFGAFDALAPAELRPIVLAVHRARCRRADSSRRRTWRWRCAALLTGSAAIGTGEPTSAGARQVAGRAAVRQRRRGSDDRVPDRRHHREHHQQPVAAERLARRAAKPGVSLQGAAADPATVGLALNARTILTGRVIQQGEC